MPTPPLPLLHALCRSLGINIFPSTLSATSPSLLLLILEALLGERLPLTQTARRCENYGDEIMVVKCLLGVLASDLLGMDLSVIDPTRIVEGRERELEVMVMALVVIARRRGIEIVLPSPGEEEYEDVILDDEELDDTLPPPIEPDTSFSSGRSFSPPIASRDVFDADHDVDRKGSSMLFEASSSVPGPLSPPPNSAAFDPYCAPLVGQEKNYRNMSNFGGTGNRDNRDVFKASSGSQGGKTVLQQMLEEFGLGLGS